MKGGAAVAVGVTLALVSASSSRGGDVYRWTDAQGVLHIADVPPPQGHGVQTETLPDRPAPMMSGQALAPLAAAPPATPGTAGKAGPAQVVIIEKDEASLGDTRHGVAGTLENTGGETAHDVAVAVHVTSPAQGDDCLSEEIDVASSLKPGEKAEFSADLDHPCFRGPTQVDLRAQWQ